MDEEVRLFAEIGVELEKELVIYELLDRLIIVVKNEHCVDKGETEGVSVEKRVDRGLVLASDTSSNANSRRGCLVLALPKLDNDVVHVCLVEVSEEVVVQVRQTVELVDSKGCNLSLILVVETC